MKVDVAAGEGNSSVTSDLQAGSFGPGRVGSLASCQVHQADLTDLQSEFHL